MELQRARRSQQQIDASDHGRFALPALDRVQSLRQREQTTGTSRVQSVAGPGEVERVRYPVRKHGPTTTGQPVPVDAIRASAPIVVRLAQERADKHTGFRSANIVGVHAYNTVSNQNGNVIMYIGAYVISAMLWRGGTPSAITRRYDPVAPKR